MRRRSDTPNRSYLKTVLDGYPHGMKRIASEVLGTFFFRSSEYGLISWAAIFPAGMALRAINGFVFSFELKADGGMIKRRCIEPYDLNDLP